MKDKELFSPTPQLSTIVVLIIGVLLSSGCVEEVPEPHPHYADMYQCDTIGRMYLHSDNTYWVFAFYESGSSHGTYAKSDDGELFLHSENMSGDPPIARRIVLLENGTNYIDDNGGNWILVDRYNQSI